MKTLQILCLLILVAGCRAHVDQWYQLQGKTMGTTYHVEYQGARDIQSSMDSLLKEINNSVSTYIPESTISQFNQQGRIDFALGSDGHAVDPLAEHFIVNLREAKRIYSLSDGAFDPTVGPLVEGWGFGRKGHQAVALDSVEVDSLLRAVGMDKINVQEHAGKSISVTAIAPGMQLDFSALAKGYGVDQVFHLISESGAENVFVEIGGEVRASGMSRRGDAWIVGINTPEEHADLAAISARLRLENASLATSGNYRNVYVVDGRKVWHTMNPKTGYPEANDLLSASVLHPDCITADALATACMVSGFEGARRLLFRVPEAEGFFIYRDSADIIATFATDKLQDYLLSE